MAGLRSVVDGQCVELVGRTVDGAEQGGQLVTFVGGDLGAALDETSDEVVEAFRSFPGAEVFADMPESCGI